MLNQFMPRWHKKKLKVGMIGMGFISNIHVEAFRSNPEVEISAISDTNQSLLIRKSHELGIPAAYPDYTFLLQDKTIDVIDVMTPHYLHKECIAAALKVRKTVICEKPVTTNLRDLDSIITLSHKFKKNVYIKQYLRFSKAYQKARELISKNVIGKPYLVQCTFTGTALNDHTDTNTWRANKYEAGGGVFMDIGIHMLDLLIYFFGNPLATYGQSRKIVSKLNQKGEEVISALIEFPSKLLINIACTHIDKGYGFRWDMKVYGEDGIITVIDVGKQEKLLKVIKENRIVYDFIEKNWWKMSNIRALQDIVNKINDDREPTVTFPQARMTIKSVLASYSSASKGVRVII